MGGAGSGAASASRSRRPTASSAGSPRSRSGCAGLGDRLGCVRVVVERPRDDGFLELLLGSADPGIRYALDLRDPSWDGVEERLAEAGAVRVGRSPGRAGWAYLRYRELRYTDGELDAIAAELPGSRQRGIETFAFFRHGDEPDAPAAALRR